MIEHGSLVMSAPSGRFRFCNLAVRISYTTFLRALGKLHKRKGSGRFSGMRCQSDGADSCAPAGLFVTPRKTYTAGRDSLDTMA